jgi:hypothetical protein
MTYTPDIWVFVEIYNPASSEITYKVLAGWYGGFARGSNWRLNSGITEIIEHEEYYEVLGASGSSYTCYKSCEKTGSPTDYVLYDLMQNKHGYKVHVVEYHEIRPDVVTKRNQNETNQSNQPNEYEGNQPR